MTGQPNRGKTSFESNNGSYAPKTNTSPGANAQLEVAEGPARDSIYVEVTGTTCHINGERGHVAGLHRESGHLVGAFVALDERPAMLYAELGATSGSRNQHAEVLSAREIDRDEFDRITGIADIREQMGWKFYPSSGYDHTAPSGEAEQFTAVRDAYAQGQADAFEKAAQVIHDFVAPSEALTGHVLRHPSGDWQVAVPQVAGYEMADKVLAAASDSLRAYAATAPTAEEAAPGPKPILHRDPILDGGDTCPVCEGHGYGRVIGPAAGGGTLHSGECLGCGGSGELPNTGQTRPCSTCTDNGSLDPLGCEVCGGDGRVRATVADRDEVYVPGHGRYGRLSRFDESDAEYVTFEAPRSFRIETDQPLTEAQLDAVAAAFRSDYGSVFNDGAIGAPQRDSDRSFVMAVVEPGRGAYTYNESLTDVIDYFRGSTFSVTSDAQTVPMRVSVYADDYEQDTRED